MSDFEKCHDLGETQINVVTAILALQMVLYLFVLGFIMFNLWRIMIMQRKFTLIPLTIFYLSAPTICVARFVDCLYFILYYRAETRLECQQTGDAAIKANTVATYFNIMMGIF